MRTLSSHPRKRTRLHNGFTLVEVMVASILFVITAMAVTGLLIQNFRLAKIQSYRSQTVTTALSVLEQIRFMGYDQIRGVYNTGAGGAFQFRLLDPSNTTTSPLGYRLQQFPVNVRDSAVVNTGWTTINLAMDPDRPAVTLPTRYFVCINRNFLAPATNSTATPRRDYFEVIVIYQWRGQGRDDSEWQSGTVRGVVSRRTPWRIGET